LIGTQFHPEKSDKIGLKIIDNFLSLWLEKLD
jgi:imidazoleglycerol phosphate synthase glutamine amidotransferase subunit HisH